MVQLIHLGNGQRGPWGTPMMCGLIGPTWIMAQQPWILSLLFHTRWSVLLFYEYSDGEIQVLNWPLELFSSLYGVSTPELIYCWMNRIVICLIVLCGLPLCISQSLGVLSGMDVMYPIIRHMGRFRLRLTSPFDIKGIDTIKIVLFSWLIFLLIFFGFFTSFII